MKGVSDKYVAARKFTSPGIWDLVRKLKDPAELSVADLASAP